MTAVKNQGGYGGDKASKQSKSAFTAKTRPFICRLSALQASENFLLEVKDVAFCTYILNNEQN